MGCRRGVPLKELEELLVTTFQQNNLSLRSLSCIATADLKKDEAGILALVDKYSVPLVCYDRQELNSVFELPSPSADNAAVEGLENSADSPNEARRPTRSEKAHSLLGIWGVAEPAALLASGSRELLVPRQKTARATIAIARKPFLNHGPPAFASNEIGG
jgi:cobalt-precorrin 5A hydrolase